MKHIYQSFSEIAETFTRGESWTHCMSKHSRNECEPWQHGVHEFAHWLDACGVKIVENPEIFDVLWDKARTYKPDSYMECPKRS
jgi:hypothetical protein